MATTSTAVARACGRTRVMAKSTEAAVPIGVLVLTTEKVRLTGGLGRVDYREGKADRRVGSRGDGACGSANGYGDTYDALRGGDDDNLNGGEGCGKGDQSDDNGVIDTGRTRPRETGRGSAHAGRH
jgi:hypothetical protein